MPAKPDTKTNPAGPLKLVVIIISLIVPLGILIGSYIVFIKTAPSYQALPRQTTPVQASLIPSQILENRSKYSGKTVTVTGRLSHDPVVCEKKGCPAEDPCCGCPAERYLTLTDPSSVATSKTTERLKIVSPQGKTFCQRRTASCEYDCPDWQEGDIYDVTGTFFSEAPPPGWHLSLNFYFTVQSHQKAKTVTIEDTTSNFFEEIKAKIKDLTSSGTYVLP